MARKRTYVKKAFESTGSTSDISANIYKSMLHSEAFTSLNNRQKVLYIYCKEMYYGLKRHPNADEKQFTFSYKKAYDYNITKNKNTFYKDIEELIKKGLIKCVECGQNTRTSNIYEYSNKWQKYGTSEFEIELSEMTANMIKKRKIQNGCINSDTNNNADSINIDTIK